MGDESDGSSESEPNETDAGEPTEDEIQAAVGPLLTTIDPNPPPRPTFANRKVIRLLVEPGSPHRTTATVTTPQMGANTVGVLFVMRRPADADKPSYAVAVDVTVTTDVKPFKATLPARESSLPLSFYCSTRGNVAIEAALAGNASVSVILECTLRW